MADLEIGKTASANLKVWVACFQPYSRPTAAGAALRKKGFKVAQQASASASGECTLAGAEVFARQTLEAHGGGGGTTSAAWAALQPFIGSAFRDAARSERNRCSDTVSKLEFRLLCAYLCAYGAMADAYTILVNGDSANANDASGQNLEHAAWMASYKKVKSHGFWELDLTDDASARDLFNKMSQGEDTLTFAAFSEHLKESEIMAESPLGDCLVIDKAKDSVGIESDAEDDVFNSSPAPAPAPEPAPAEVASSPPPAAKKPATAAAPSSSPPPPTKPAPGVERADLLRKPSVNVAWDPTTATTSSPRLSPQPPVSPRSLPGSSGGANSRSSLVSATSSREPRASSERLPGAGPVGSARSPISPSSGGGAGGPSTGDAKRDRELEDSAIRRGALKSRTQDILAGAAARRSGSPRAGGPSVRPGSASPRASYTSSSPGGGAVSRPPPRAGGGSPRSAPPVAMLPVVPRMGSPRAMQMEFASTGLASTGDWARDRELENAAVRRIDVKSRTEALLAARAAKRGLYSPRVGRLSNSNPASPTSPSSPTTTNAPGGGGSGQDEQEYEQAGDGGEGNDDGDDVEVGEAKEEAGVEAGVEDGFAGDTPGKPLMLRGASFSNNNDEESVDGDAAASAAASPSKSGIASTVTAECRDFEVCFEPYTAKTDAGAALRKEGFKLADPNGNGLCSLAEIEGFVLQTLLKAYPRDKVFKSMEKGRDLFDAFRPCYIKAFNDAKDYKSDTGAVIAGTKKSTADDFVSFGEFRLMCAYLCIYARTYDAFSLVDGGGSGRVGDDRKIDKAEWAAGYVDTIGHGFVGLEGLTDQQSAFALFATIDDNSGTLMLDEWCTYLKNSEIAAKTAMGVLLAEDEDNAKKVGGSQSLNLSSDYRRANKYTAAASSSPASPRSAGSGPAVRSAYVPQGAKPKAIKQPTPSPPSATLHAAKTNAKKEAVVQEKLSAKQQKEAALAAARESREADAKHAAQLANHQAKLATSKKDLAAASLGSPKKLTPAEVHAENERKRIERKHQQRGSATAMKVAASVTAKLQAEQDKAARLQSDTAHLKFAHGQPPPPKTRLEQKAAAEAAAAAAEAAAQQAAHEAAEAAEAEATAQAMSAEAATAAKIKRKAADAERERLRIEAEALRANIANEEAQRLHAFANRPYWEGLSGTAEDNEAYQPRFVKADPTMDFLTANFLKRLGLEAYEEVLTKLGVRVRDDFDKLCRDGDDGTEDRGSGDAVENLEIKAGMAPFEARKLVSKVREEGAALAAEKEAELAKQRAIDEEARRAREAQALAESETSHTELIKAEKLLVERQKILAKEVATARNAQEKQAMQDAKLARKEAAAAAKKAAQEAKNERRNHKANNNIATPSGATAAAAATGGTAGGDSSTPTTGGLASAGPGSVFTARVDVQDSAGKWVVRDASYFSASRSLLLSEVLTKGQSGLGGVLARYSAVCGTAKNKGKVGLFGRRIRVEVFLQGSSIPWPFLAYGKAEADKWVAALNVMSNTSNAPSPVPAVGEETAPPPPPPPPPPADDASTTKAEFPVEAASENGKDNDNNREEVKEDVKVEESPAVVVDAAATAKEDKEALEKLRKEKEQKEAQAKEAQELEDAYQAAKAKSAALDSDTGKEDDGLEAKPFDEGAEMAKLLAESVASAKASEEERQATLKAQEDADVAEAMASTASDAAAAEEELKLVSQRQKEYLETMLPAEDAKAKKECQVGAGAQVADVARDGSCVPRSLLLACGKPSDDAAVAELRTQVVSAMRAQPARYLAAVLQGATFTSAKNKKGKSGGGGDDATRFEVHCERMAQPSTFFEEPEFQAAADVLGTDVIVDAVVVEGGTHERRVYKSLTVNPALPAAATVLLSVCKVNASHCEAVLPASGQVQPRPPASAEPGGGAENGGNVEDNNDGGSEVGSLSGGEDEEGEDPDDRRIDSEDGEPYTKDEFLDQYGNLDKWETAPDERRIDDEDGEAYTRADFWEVYGDYVKWDSAQPAPRGGD